MRQVALAFALMVSLAGSAFAMGTEPEANDKTPAASACKDKDPAKCPKQKAEECKSNSASKDCKKKKDNQTLLEGYRAAVALAEAGRYPEALTAMQALDDGSSADVVTYIGFIKRKMGHMAEAQMYYEAALHMQRDHRGALEYYGEWFVMMGRIDKARQNLSRIATVYGSDTKEYAALAKMIDAAQKS